MNRIFFIAVLLLAYSCKSNSSNEQALAKVGKEYLYPSFFLGDDYSAAEVESITEEQKNDWVKRQLWYQEAIKNVEENRILENKVKDYEQSLYINAYQEQLSQEKANLVSNEDVVKYYAEHKSEYELNESLYKIQYLELSSEISNIEDIISSLNKEVQSQFVIDHCTEHKDLCLLEPTWVNDEKLNVLELPDFVRTPSTKFGQYFKADKKVCIYRILERKLEGEYSPLELVNNEIASIVYFNKSKEILKKQEDKLFKNAQNKQDFEIY